MASLGKVLRVFCRNLVPGLLVMSCVMASAQLAMGHDTAKTDASGHPTVFTTVAPGTPTNQPGRGLQFLCIPEVIVYNAGVAPVYSDAKTPWVEGLSVILSKIPYVEGQVMWPNSKFREIRGLFTRRFVGNGLPNHATGEFPVREGSAAYPYYNAAAAPEPYGTADQIPTSAYDLDITVPRWPVYFGKPTCISHLISGVATQTGVTWHANIALGDGWVDPIAALPNDECFGHPYDEQYHYHGWSWKCFPNQGSAKKHSPLFGYALDGFGIYGPRGDGGKLVKNTDLDECHGHFGTVEWDGYKKYMYHYHLNSEFPYGPGCLKGRPLAKVNDAMFKKYAPKFPTKPTE